MYRCCTWQIWKKIKKSLGNANMSVLAWMSGRCWHANTNAPSSRAICDQLPHHHHPPPRIIIPYEYTHKHSLHMPLPLKKKPSPPPQLSVSAAGLLNWLWSVAFGCALLRALPNWSQWRFSRRTLSPVVLCSRAQRAVLYSGGSVAPPPLRASAAARSSCVGMCVFNALQWGRLSWKARCVCFCAARENVCVPI